MDYPLIGSPYIFDPGDRFTTGTKTGVVLAHAFVGVPGCGPWYWVTDHPASEHGGVLPCCESSMTRVE